MGADSDKKTQNTYLSMILDLRSKTFMFKIFDRKI